MIRKYENSAPKIDETCFIATQTEVIGKVILAENVNVWYGCILRGDINSIEIGANTNVQENTVIHVDKSLENSDYGKTIIGKNVTIGHRALIHGCTIEDNCLIGMGAIILSGAVIGEGSIIGAGALVKENEKIPPRSLVVGIPGKVRGKVSDERVAAILNSAKHYVDLAEKHKKII